MHGLALVANLEHLRLEAHAVALFARNEDVRQELHFDAHFTFALARFAASARDVERKVTRREAARACILRQREELADRIERLEIGDGIRSRRSPNGRLVDEYDVGDVLEPLQFAERTDAAIPVTLRALDGRVQDIMNERGLTRAAHPRHTRQRVE